eukprot:scpid59782/ scgid27432/ 
MKWCNARLKVKMPFFSGHKSCQKSGENTMDMGSTFFSATTVSSLHAHSIEGAYLTFTPDIKKNIDECYSMTAIPCTKATSGAGITAHSHAQVLQHTDIPTHKSINKCC